MASNLVLRPRLHAQIFSFVRQARSSGLEADWINLISGKNVPTERLEKLDQLIVSVLQTASPKELEIDHSKPWARLRPDPFTHRNVIQYEIPRATRENLRDQALKEAKDEAAAKQLYRQKVSALRNQLIRRYAVGQTAPVVPPLRVHLDQEVPKHPEINARLQQIQETYPRFRKLINSDPNLQSIFNPGPESRDSADPKTPQELLELLNKTKPVSDLEVQVHEVCVEFTQEIIAVQHEQQDKKVKIQKQERSPFDPDWNTLTRNPHLASAVPEVRDRFTALRKVYYPVSVEHEQSTAAVPQLHVLLGALKKMQRISQEQGLPVLQRIEAVAKRVEQLHEEKVFWANFKVTDDFSKLFPEGQEEFAKHLINQNWTWDKSTSKPLL